MQLSGSFVRFTLQDMTGTDILLLLLVLMALAGVASYWVGHRQRLAVMRAQHAATIAAHQQELRQATQLLLAAIAAAQTDAGRHATAAAEQASSAQQQLVQHLQHLQTDLAAQHTATQQQLAQLDATLRETVDLNL